MKICFATGGIIARRAALVVMALHAIVGIGRQSWADGWHNAALATGSIDEWTRDVDAALKKTDEALGSQTLRAGTIKDLDRLKREPDSDPRPLSTHERVARLNATLSDQERAVLARKARDAGELLAYMDPKNIFPQEFPKFPLGQIGAYRKKAKGMLKAMGPIGASAVVDRLKQELMGTVDHMGLTLHDQYYADLFESLEHAVNNGDLSTTDLNELIMAASGQKRGRQKLLADKVRAVLLKTEGVPVSRLLEWSASMQERRWKETFASEANRKLGDATPDDLLDVLELSGLPDTTKRKATFELGQHVSTMTVLELLRVLKVDDLAIQRAAAVRLQSLAPTYSEVKRDLPQIWKLTESPDKIVATAARQQAQNAFTRAKMSDCIRELGMADPELAKFIWAQIDYKIDRADAGRKDTYRQVAAYMMTGDESAKTSGAALDVLGRIKGRDSARLLIANLAKLDKDLLGKAGRTLRTLTGQNFGPREGAGLLEVSTAKKKWEQWLADNP